MPGSHGRGPVPALRRPVSSRRQSRTAATSAAVSTSRTRGRGVQLRDRVQAVGAEQDQVGAQGGPGRARVRSGTIWSAAASRRATCSGPSRCLGGDVEGVEVAGGGLTEQGAGSWSSRRVVVAEREASSRARIGSRRSVAVSGWVGRGG